MDATTIGPYRLEKLLGFGGMGEVHLAYDTRRDRMVALKLLPEVLGRDPEYQQRFRRESHVAARLRDPHVIPIHDYGEIDGQLYIDMRLVDGRNIRQMLDEEDSLSPERSVHLIAQVGEALEAAHADGLVHRDIKPSNVLVTKNDFVYVVDFGIARSVGTNRTSLTLTGVTVGTLDYMAPERFSTKAIDGRADVYSMACLFYECLTGLPPFAGDDLATLMYAHLFSDTPRPSDTVEGLPVAMDDVIARGMAKALDDRFATPAELVAAAREALTGTAPAPKSPPATAASERPTSPETRFVSPRERASWPPPSTAPRPGDTATPEPAGSAAETARSATPPPPTVTPAAAARTPAPGAGTSPTEAAPAEAAPAEASSREASPREASPTAATESIPTAAAATEAVPTGTPPTEVVSTASAPTEAIPTAAAGMSSPARRQTPPPTEAAPSWHSAAPAPPPLPDGVIPERPRRSGRRSWLLAAGAVVLVVLVTTGVLVGNSGLFDGTGSAAVSGPAAPQANTAAQAPPVAVEPRAASVAVPTVQGTVEIGGTPGYMDIAPNGRFAYIAGRDSMTVTVLDLTINRVTATIPVPEGPPQFVSFSPSGDRAYISVYNTDRTVNLIAVLDTASNTVVGTVPVGRRPFASATTPDGRLLYVPSHDDGRLDVVDTETLTVVREIQVAPNPHWVAVAENGTRLYTANHESNLVSVLDLATDEVVDTIPVGVSPHSIAVSPDGARVAVVNFDSHEVSIIAAETHEVLATVPVGTKPQDVAWAADGRYLYTADVEADTISVVDTTAYQVRASIPAGDGPTSVVVTPDGLHAYVTELNDGVVLILDLTAV